MARTFSSCLALTLEIRSWCRAFRPEIRRSCFSRRSAIRDTCRPAVFSISVVNAARVCSSRPSASRSCALEDFSFSVARRLLSAAAMLFSFRAAISCMRASSCWVCLALTRTERS